LKEIVVVLVIGAALAGSASAKLHRPPAAASASDWGQFGFDPARQNSGPALTGITVSNAAALQRQAIPVQGTVDSSPIYVRGVRVDGRRYDVFVVTTTYGKAFAIDGATGDVLWSFTPSGSASAAGTRQITTSSPALDPSRQFVYSASPDGLVHKLSIGTGEEVTADGWPAAVTLDPAHEKIGTAINISRDYVIVTTGGYPGDLPPYQGHVVALDPTTGRVVNVWNALCSDVHVLLDTTACGESGAAIWARAGVVVEPGTGNLLVATGNGVWDARTQWSSSVVELSPDAGRVLRYWTPANWEYLSSQDLDVGSAAPALLNDHLVVQGGKSGVLSLLDLRKFHAPPKPGAKPVVGGALETVPTPGRAMLFSAPAVWHGGSETWLFVADSKGTSAFTLTQNRLKLRWTNTAAGTSPVVAGDLLYVYDWDAGRLNVYRPTTGVSVASLPAGRGHWSSPIVTDGRVALGEGDANGHVDFGVLNIYRLP
jgi:hypothetical protein